MDDYPLAELFWTMLWFFGLVAWIGVLFTVFRDIVVSSDLPGWGKALWTLFAVLLPFLGVFCYLVVRGGTMHRRQAAAAAERASAAAAGWRAPGPPSVVDELLRLTRLREDGVLSGEEYESLRVALMFGAGVGPQPAAAPS